MAELEAEVTERLGRPFAEIKEELGELFDMPWDEVQVVIETSATKRDRTHADVICELVERAERKPPVRERVRRSMIRWIGKPWRERPNPWDDFKHRVPDPPDPTRTADGDFDEWTPLRAEED